MGQILAKLRQLVNYIIDKFFSNGGDSKGGSKDDSKGGAKDDSKGGAKDDSKGGAKDDSKGGAKDDSKGGAKDQASHDNKELSDGLNTVPDDAHVISVQDYDHDEETTDDIVEQPQVSDAHLVTIPDGLFTNEVPNIVLEKWIKYYSNFHNILLVGEGDFSFSACLAKAFGSAVNMTATSLDSKNFLKKNYKMSMSNIDDLKIRGATVIHNLDATQMATHPQLNGQKFDRIVYNFPLAGFFEGYSRKKKLNLNRNLIRLFMKNAKEMVAENGEIHITHKAHGFFLEWNLEKLANNNGLRLIKDVQFSLRDYPGYNTKYGFGGDENFDCYGSRTYKFGL